MNDDTSIETSEREALPFDAAVPTTAAAAPTTDPLAALPVDADRLLQLCGGVLTFSVMNADKSAYVVSFDQRRDFNPKRLAEEWLSQHQTNFPDRFAGYQVVREYVKSEKDELATALCAEVVSLRQQLQAARDENAKLERRDAVFTAAIHNHCLAMQAALIEMHIGRGAEAAMVWISNTLRGPGLLPDVDEAEALGGAQAWFDAKTAEEDARVAALAQVGSPR